MEKPVPSFIEGILCRGTSYTYIGGGPGVMHWFEQRVASLPTGAYVRLTAEVIDPNPKDK